MGRVSHSRLAPVPHAFAYRLFLLRVDLDTVPTLDRNYWLSGTRWWKPVRFDATDFLGVKGQGGSAGQDAAALRSAVLATLAAHGIAAPIGAIELVAHARIFGYVFNPVSFFFCYGTSADRPLVAMIAEVHNTFGERHAYVLPAADAEGPGTWRDKKVFHVSPFFTLDGTYRFEVSGDGDVLDVQIDLQRDGRPMFLSRLRMSAQPLTDRALAGALVRFPFMTARVMAAIHWEALRLWRKGLPYLSKPAYDPARARATRR